MSASVPNSGAICLLPNSLLPRTGELGFGWNKKLFSASFNHIPANLVPHKELLLYSSLTERKTFSNVFLITYLNCSNALSKILTEENSLSCGNTDMGLTDMWFRSQWADL